MFIKKSLTLCLLLFACFCSAFSDNAQPVSSAITVGVFYLYPPFVYSTSIGFDVNLMQAICDSQQLQCTFVNHTMDELLSDLSKPSGQVDVAISAISITRARSQYVSFVGPYYQSTMSFLAKAGVATDINLLQLKNKKIGTLKSSIFYYYLKNMYGNTDHSKTDDQGSIYSYLKNFFGNFGNDDNIKIYDGQNDLLQALTNNDVDVITLDTPVAEYWQNQSECKLKVVGPAIKIPSDEGYGLVLRKNNPALKVLLEQGLQRVSYNRTYARLVDTYLSGHLNKCPLP